MLWLRRTVGRTRATTSFFFLSLSLCPLFSVKFVLGRFLCAWSPLGDLMGGFSYTCFFCDDEAMRQRGAPPEKRRASLSAGPTGAMASVVVSCTEFMRHQSPFFCSLLFSFSFFFRNKEKGNIPITSSGFLRTYRHPFFLSRLRDAASSARSPPESKKYFLP
nr:hypothetical protein [Pandoravirus aubagnensis]